MKFDRRFPGVSETGRTLWVFIGDGRFNKPQTGRATKAQGIALGIMAVRGNEP
jgi:hypothetical protein